MMWVVYYVFSIEIIFRYTDSIRGWGKGEVLLIVATLFFIDGLRILLFHDNLRDLPSQITEGNLDLFLIKPLDAQFWLSLRRLNFTEVNLFLIGGLLWWYAFSLTAIQLTIINFFIYTILTLCGFLITYALWSMLVTCAFWFPRIDNITELFNRILEISKYPTSIFKGAIRIIVYTVIPLGVITNFPVQALAGSLTAVNMFYGLCLTAIFLLGARAFWLVAVKNYTSASS